MEDLETRNVILWGSSGTGKTILLTEVLGMKLSQFKKQNIPMKIIVSSFGTSRFQPKKLMEDMESKYLPQLELEKGQFIMGKDLCKGKYQHFYSNMYLMLLLSSI